MKRRSKRASRPVRGSTRRGRREHQRRFQVVGEVNSLSDAPRRRPGGRGRRDPVQGMLLLVALLPRRPPDDEDREQLLFVDGVTRLTGPNPVSHPPREPPFDLQRKGSGGGGRRRGTRRARPRRAVAQRRQMSVKAHRTTGAQTTEPGHHNGEFVKDVRVSPVGGGVGVVEEDELSRAARRPRTGASGSLPRSRRTTRSRGLDGQNCGRRAPRVGARRACFWGYLGSISCQKKCVKKCHCVNRERSTLHVPQNSSGRRQRSAEKPPSRDDTSDEVPKLQFKIGSVRGLMNATLLQRIPRSTMIAQLGGPNTAELSQMPQNTVIIESVGRRTCV